MGWFSRRTEEDITQQLDQLRITLAEIHSSLVVRDPGTAMPATAYDGLRKTVMAGAQARRAHLVQLTSFADAVARGSDLETLSSLVEEWCGQAGIAQVSDGPPEFYEILGGSGDQLQVLEAAWVDVGQNNALIRRGKAQLIETPKPRALDPVPATPEPNDGVGPVPASQGDGPGPEAAVTDPAPVQAPAEAATSKSDAPTPDEAEPTSVEALFDDQATAPSPSGEASTDVHAPEPAEQTEPEHAAENEDVSPVVENPAGERGHVLPEQHNPEPDMPQQEDTHEKEDRS